MTERSASLRLVCELGRYLRRLVLTMAATALAVFVMIDLSIRGGFAATLLPGGANPNSERDQRIVEQFDLDGHVLQRYINWVWNALQGDFGRSTVRAQPVAEMIGPRLSITGELMVVSVLVTVAIGVPLGVLAAAWAGRRAGRVVDIGLSLSQSLPVFVTAPFIVLAFSLKLGWLPATSWVRPTVSVADHLRHLALPVLAVALAEFGAIGRVVRADVARTMQDDYVTVAMGKGLPSRFVLFRHALRPASLGLLNVVGLNIGSMLSGAVIVEIIFGIGGLGQLLFNSTIQRDLYLLLGITCFVVFVFVTLNFIVDVLMRSLDPRISRS